jgi:hypothetical protein
VTDLADHRLGQYCPSRLLAEGVGVIPDIIAVPENVFAAAKKLMQRQLHGTAPLAAAGH